MATVALNSSLPALPLPAAVRASQRAGQRDAVVRNVQQALAAAQQGPSGPERRREPRHPYPYPIHLTPLNRAGTPVVDETFVVIGKHLSDHGLDFYHTGPVSHRRVIASLDAGDAGWIGLLLELNWCRFTRHGWYDNGGRFLGAVASPLGER
jgi:hypothetical protein